MAIDDTAVHRQSADEIIAATQHWLEKAVIGLNLCPFAKAVHTKKQIRYAISKATTTEGLHQDLVAELLFLHRADPVEVDTSLLVHPWVLTDFLDYNDFIDVVDATIEELNLEGEIQVASFHPQYQFADTQPDDISNFTNRSPYPVLHLLRETSIERAVDAFPDAEEIYNRNIETMQHLGMEGWKLLNIHGAVPNSFRNNEKQ